MKSSVQLGRKKAAVGIGAVLLLAASLVTVSATLSAQTTDCSGDQTVGFGTQFFGTGDFGNHLLSINNADGGTALAPVAVNLPAGSYDVGYVSTDGYVGRDTVSQPSEQWVVDFVGADGAVLATTGATADVPDNIEQGYSNGQFGTIELSADAVSIVARHAAPGGGNTPNSVRPVCLGITDVTPQPAAVAADPCDGAAADGSDGATAADGSACVDPCADSTVGDGTLDADGTACVEPCVDALVAAGVTADDAVAACGSEDCVADAVDAGADADAAAAACDEVTTGDGGTDATCEETLQASGATPSGAEAACDAATSELCEEMAIADEQNTEAVAEEACSEIVDVAVGGAVQTAEPAGTDTTDNEAAPAPAAAQPAVAGATITAPVAQAQTGDPTFTG